MNALAWAIVGGVVGYILGMVVCYAIWVIQLRRQGWL